MVLRRIFGPKRGKVMEEQRKLHNGELHNWYLPPDFNRQFKSKRMRWVGHVACTGEGRNAYTVLVGSPEGKNRLEDRDADGRMGSKWTSRRRTVGGDVEWIHLAQDRDHWHAVVNALMNLQVLAPRS
jgi:hypothetical protein